MRADEQYSPKMNLLASPILILYVDTFKLKSSFVSFRNEY